MSALLQVDHAWWIASRAAGIIAYVLLSLSVVTGLAMSLGLVPKRGKRELFVAHERIAIAALVTLAAHGLFLLGDDWLKAGWEDILIPFAGSYRPFWTGLGVIAGYLTVAMSLSYYARRQMRPGRWRNLHRWVPVAWALGALHTLGAGSDSASGWMKVMLLATVTAIATMLAWRALATGPRPATSGSQPSRA